MIWQDIEFTITERADGDVACRVCGRAYRLHPQADNAPIMHYLCAGAWPREGRSEVRWVKT